MELIAQLLLESRICAYIEWLDNKLIMTPNNNINKDSLLVLLSAKRKPANHKVLHIPWSQETIPTSRISLASILCTQGLFTPVAGDAWRVPLCGGSFWWAQTESSPLTARCYF